LFASLRLAISLARSFALSLFSALRAVTVPLLARVPFDVLINLDLVLVTLLLLVLLALSALL